jgi:hypothetical protein
MDREFKRHNWTAEDDSRLADMFRAHLPAVEVAFRMGLRQNQVRKRVQWLRACGADIPARRRWSDEESEKLVSMWNAKASLDEISKALDRPKAQICAKAVSLRINGCRVGKPEVRGKTPPKQIAAREIIREVCREYHITLDEMASDARNHRVIQPRQLAMALCYQFSGNSFPAIGGMFNRDHTSVIHACRVAGGKYPDAMASLTQRIVSMIEGKKNERDTMPETDASIPAAKRGSESLGEGRRAA